MTGTYVHLSTICRTVQYLGFSRKRLQFVALQCDDNLRGRFMAEISIFGPDMFVWPASTERIPSEHMSMEYVDCLLETSDLDIVELKLALLL